MGDWYVIGNIPTSIEREAFNAVESYRLDADGTIATTFTFREGAFDGALKTYCPRGFVLDTHSNAVWGMHFVWPIKADYRIVFVSGDYEHTIVGREKRDYVWIMARTPQTGRCRLRGAARDRAREGYDMSKVRRVPQQWPERTRRGQRGGVLVKIAIVGSGIAGNVAAYHLHREHDDHGVRGRAITSAATRTRTRSSTRASASPSTPASSSSTTARTRTSSRCWTSSAWSCRRAR